MSNSSTRTPAVPAVLDDPMRNRGVAFTLADRAALGLTGRLAQLARAAARRKVSQLEEALEGAEFFTPVHAGLLSAMLARIDRADSAIGQVSQVTGELLAPYEEQLQQVEAMPGWGRRSAQDAIAETGIDMTRFRTPAHLVSWAGRSPLDQ